MAVQVYDKKAYREKREKEMQDMKETIVSMMENYHENPEHLAELAAFSSRFYCYSMRNQTLIHKQNKGARFVASFEKFKQLGYSVKRGERGMKIFVPAPLTLFRDRENGDWMPLSEASEYDKWAIQNGMYDTKKITYFKIGTVFDIAQTDCPIEDYPKLFHMGYSSEQHEQIYQALKSYCEQELSCSVSVQDIKSISLRGFYSDAAHSITLNDRLEDTQKLSVLTHEMGHALLHHSPNMSETQRELEADIVSIMLQTHFGIDIPDSRKAHLAEHYRNYQNGVEQTEGDELSANILACFQKANDIYKQHIERMDAVVDQFLQQEENIKLEIRPLTKEERLYIQKQSLQIQGQTGYFGCLQGNFGKAGKEFFTEWDGKYYGEKATKLETELDGVVYQLQSPGIGMMANRAAMQSYLESRPDNILPNHQSYGFRVDTESNAYLICCNPNAEETDFSCYCYESQWLDRHMEKAKEGIWFITPRYEELFRIPDGGKIVITNVAGEQTEHICRYIDPTHLEIENNLLHVCQFAEQLERNGSVCEPKPEEQQTEIIDQSNMDQAFENYFEKQNGISYSEVSTKENSQSDFEM